jgi:hypothetical protein
LESFVPAADEVSRLQRVDTPEGRYFRVLAEQGHYAGRTTPTDTRQGIYAAAPNGRLLASINTRSAEQMARMLREALAAWERLPDDERWLADEELRGDPGRRDVEQYPEGGLALRAHYRDLPRDGAQDDWRADARNRDYAWFKADEAARFVPAETVGATREVDAALLVRLARLHLVDIVRGQSHVYRPEHVERAALTARVTAVEDGALVLAFDGAVRLAEEGTWGVAGYHDMRKEEQRPQSRGFDGRLLGRGRWDVAAQRFTAFELVALGTRWGGTRYNGRADDLEPGAMGVAFVLAPPEERVAPAAAWEYRW